MKCQKLQMYLVDVNFWNTYRLLVAPKSKIDSDRNNKINSSFSYLFQRLFHIVLKDIEYFDLYSYACRYLPNLILFAFWRIFFITKQKVLTSFSLSLQHLFRITLKDIDYFILFSYAWRYLNSLVLFESGIYLLSTESGVSSK